MIIINKKTKFFNICTKQQKCYRCEKLKYLKKNCRTKILIASTILTVVIKKIKKKRNIFDLNCYRKSKKMLKLFRYFVRKI